MIPRMFWQSESARYEPPKDPRLEPVEGDEIDELVNRQLSGELRGVWDWSTRAPE